MATDVSELTAAVLINLLGLLAPEDGGITDLSNAVNYLSVDMALHYRRL
jgi:hypothetical protein